MISTLNCKGQILDLSTPVVMGILNTTPDSFYDGGLYNSVEKALEQAEKMIQEGATILDIGGASSRPNAGIVSEAEELSRTIPVITAIHQKWPKQIISIDTWRASVAREAVANGASIINDISGGSMDPHMFQTVADCHVPYILMHIQGTPQDMQGTPHYDDIITEILDYFIEKVGQLRALGVKDIVLDPGFGFGKTIKHNYTLFRSMDQFSLVLNLPLLVGISRKSMIYKLLETSSADTLSATCALNALALERGVSILRVHDVKPAIDVIKIWQAYSL
jgi:dihydropteroate synthase